MTNLLIIIFVTFLSWLSVYIDGRLYDKHKTKGDYAKVIIFANIVVFSSIFVLKWLSPNGDPVAVLRPYVDKIQGNGNIVGVDGLDEKMFGGEAPF